MRRRPPTTSPRPGWLGGLLLVVSAFSLLMMPVEYRAGAALPHPHAIFQAYLDVSSGTTHHHHGEHGVSRPHVTHNVEALPLVMHGGEPDVPLLKEMTSPAERAAAYLALLAGALMLLVLWTWYRPVFSIRPLLGEIHLRPEPPPPRWYATGLKPRAEPTKPLRG